MRLDDRTRERLVERLKAHAAAGRLDPRELERRVELVLRAESETDVPPAFAGLRPTDHADAGTAPQPRGRARRLRGWRAGHGEIDRPDPTWQPTNERFRDPRTERVMRVWLDTNGNRHYVAET